MHNYNKPIHFSQLLFNAFLMTKLQVRLYRNLCMYGLFILEDFSDRDFFMWGNLAKFFTEYPSPTMLRM